MVGRVARAISRTARTAPLVADRPAARTGLSSTTSRRAALMFIARAASVTEGQIVGENSRDNELRREHHQGKENSPNARVGPPTRAFAVRGSSTRAMSRMIREDELLESRRSRSACARARWPAAAASVPERSPRSKNGWPYGAAASILIPCCAASSNAPESWEDAWRSSTATGT